MWGLSFPAKSVGLEYLPPLVFAAFRYDIAVVLLLGYDVATTDSWRSVGRNNVEAILGGGVFLIAGNGLLFVGQQTVPSGDVAILQALVPGMAALSALLLVDEGLLGGRRRRRRTGLPRRLLDGAGVPHLLHHPR